MCGRFTLTSSGQELAENFDLAEIPELRPRFNVAPTQQVAVIRADHADEPFLAFHRWGLVPFWAKDPAIGNRMINARSETVADKPAFRAALRKRRCIVPASGFYEWGGAGKARHPHLFRMRDRAVFGIAGLWEHWSDAEGAEMLSCTLLTTNANESVRPVHLRMPVILSPTDYRTWLDPEHSDPDRVISLLVPCASDWLDDTMVGTRVNDPRYDDPSCTDALSPSAPARS